MHRLPDGEIALELNVWCGAAKDRGLAVASMIWWSITSTMHSQRRKYSAREAAEAAVSVRIRISRVLVSSGPNPVSRGRRPDPAHENCSSGVRGSAASSPVTLCLKHGGGGG